MNADERLYYERDNELLPIWAETSIADSAATVVELGQGTGWLFQCAGACYVASYATEAEATTGAASGGLVLPGSYTLRAVVLRPGHGWVALKSISGTINVRRRRIGAGPGAADSWQPEAP